MNTPDIRWQQRFANFKKALVQLKKCRRTQQAASIVFTGETRRYPGL